MQRRAQYTRRVNQDTAETNEDIIKGSKTNN